jgi:hypothetical protein
MTTPITAVVVLLLTQVPDDAWAKGTARAATGPTDQAVYREWAKAVRETSESAKRMRGKTAAQQWAWAAKTAKGKEDKLRARYRLSQYHMFLILETGLSQNWPTDKPEDRGLVESAVAERRANLDAMILNEEIEEWVDKHRTPDRPAGSTVPLEVYQREFSAAAARAGVETTELRKRVPFTLCEVKLPDGKLCGRKTVGNRGAKCYEHRTDSP